MKSLIPQDFDPCFTWPAQLATVLASSLLFAVRLDPFTCSCYALGWQTVAFHQQKKGFTSKNQQTLGLNMQKVAFTTENWIATSGY